MKVFNYKCTNCGSSQFEKIGDSYKCKYCGNIQDIIKTEESEKETQYKQEKSNCSFNIDGETKSLLIRLILCIVCGWIGVHKFFEGKIFLGIIYLFSGGLFGIGIFVDAVKYICQLVDNSKKRSKS